MAHRRLDPAPLLGLIRGGGALQQLRVLLQVVPRPRLDVEGEPFHEVPHVRRPVQDSHRLQASGDLYRATYAGPYCPRCEAFYQEDELPDGNCPVHGLPCEVEEEENTFFRLSRYQRELERLVAQIPVGRIGRPEEAARVVAFLAHDASSYITGQIWAVNGGLDM